MDSIRSYGNAQVQATENECDTQAGLHPKQREQSQRAPPTLAGPGGAPPPPPYQSADSTQGGATTSATLPDTPIGTSTPAPPTPLQAATQQQHPPLQSPTTTTLPTTDIPPLTIQPNPTTNPTPPPTTEIPSSLASSGLSSTTTTTNHNITTISPTPARAPTPTTAAEQHTTYSQHHHVQTTPTHYYTQNPTEGFSSYYENPPNYSTIHHFPPSTFPPYIQNPHHETSDINHDNTTNEFDYGPPTSPTHTTYPSVYYPAGFEGVYDASGRYVNHNQYPHEWDTAPEQHAQLHQWPDHPDYRRPRRTPFTSSRGRAYRQPYAHSQFLETRSQVGHQATVISLRRTKYIYTHHPLKQPNRQIPHTGHKAAGTWSRTT